MSLAMSITYPEKWTGQSCYRVTNSQSDESSEHSHISTFIRNSSNAMAFKAKDNCDFAKPRLKRMLECASLRI